MINKLILILVCSKLLHLTKVLLATVSLLLLIGLIINIPAAAHVVVLILVSFFTLLLLRDEKILYKCDRTGNTGSLFVTLYNLKSGLFRERLLIKLKKINVLRVIKLDIALESSFFLFAFVCHLVFPSGLYSSLSGASSDQTRINVLEERIDDLKRAREIAINGELGGEVDEVIRELEYGNIAAGMERIDVISQKMMDSPKRSNKADSKGYDSIINALGQIASLLENEGLLYEINLKNTREEIASLRKTQPKGNNAVKVSNIRNVTEASYNDDQFGRLPLKYRIYLKEFFRSK